MSGKTRAVQPVPGGDGRARPREDLGVPVLDRNEAGITVVLTAILIVSVLTLICFAFNYSYARLIQRELQAAADSAANAAALSLCATKTCWDEAKAVAISVIAQQRIDGGLGDSKTIQLDPAGGPEWEDSAKNFRVSIERGRYVEPGIFTSLEPTEENPLLAPQVIANAVRVTIARLAMSFLAEPTGLRSDGYSVFAVASGLKGQTATNCAAPFALHVCSVMNGGAFSLNQLSVADRFFMRSQRFCADGAPGCENIVPEFFYTPSSDTSGGTLTHASPECKWQGRLFPDRRDHFGVVGIPESAGQISEERVREIIEDATHPCVSAKLGERFNVLHDGLTEPETEDAHWRQISTTYDANDAAHPPYGSLYPSTIAGAKLHDETTCQAADKGFGACNSRRYVFNGVRGETYFAGERYANNFYPGGTSRGTVWPPVTADTAMWRVQIPLIASSEEVAHLVCPGGTGEGNDPGIVVGADYQIVGFINVNVYDADVGSPPPLNPSMLSLPSSLVGSDQVWGFANGTTPVSGHPDCYEAGKGTGSDAASPECVPCDLVRGRIAGETDFVATVQYSPLRVHLVNESNEPPPGASPAGGPTPTPQNFPTETPRPSPTPTQPPTTPGPTPTPVATPTRRVCQCGIMEAASAQCLSNLFNANSASCPDRIYLVMAAAQVQCSSACTWWACYADGEPIGVFTSPLSGFETQYSAYDGYLVGLCLHQQHPFNYPNPIDFLPPRPDPMSYPRAPGW